MGPSGALARTWLRRNIVATVTLVVLVALASRAMSGSFAAARRSSSALDRFLEFNRPPTLRVYGESIDMAAVKALPGVIGASEGLVANVANVVAAVPARAARRLRPADVLRSQ